MQRLQLLLKNEENLWRLGVGLLPFLWFAALIRVKFTYGDGPELLLAARNLGGAHPSGYPLWTLLAHIPAQIPWPSPFWVTAVTMSALPTAITASVLYVLSRELGIRRGFAATVGLVWAFGATVAYLATRIEVYALHSMFAALSLLFLWRFLSEKNIRDARLSVLFVCLGLTNHLTTALLILPIVIGLMLADHRQILKPRNVGIFLGIAAACASIYLYLPWQAMANVGDRISWNDPQTLERFWFHVSGQEYSIFRGTAKIAANLKDFVQSSESAYFPGILVVSILGAIELVWRNWRFLIVLSVIFVSFLAYIATYTINDISTYYTILHMLIVVTAGVGFEWFLKSRFEDKHDWVVNLVLTGCLAWVVGLAWRTQVNHYREALAEDMSAQVIADMKDPSIIFTSVDGHSFPMWYQRFANHTDRTMLPIDTVMFGLANKTWYRDWFRAHFDWVNWPDESTVLTKNWRQWLIENNPEINFYTMLNGRYNVPGSYAVNRGWHFEVVRGAQDVSRAQKNAAHIYTAYSTRFGRNTFFHDSALSYTSGERRLGCVAEWRNNPQMVGYWTFYSPSGKVIEMPAHDLPPKTDMSWEYLEKAEQVPGEWRCEVRVPGQPTMETRFTLK